MKWYLSSAHGGRKSAVARKPYNPILGEVFRCHWKLPPSPEKREEVPDIPVPWCTQDDLVFISEQVKSSFKITSKHNQNSDAIAYVHMITYAHRESRGELFNYWSQAVCKNGVFDVFSSIYSFQFHI